ncbi:unnamed protein product [Pedinophyceae sp. YPF-701]|nr:unnamed protein product [Pedinophyceae sp. YPF-701]
MEVDRSLFLSALRVIDECASALENCQIAQDAVPLFAPFAERTRTVLRFYLHQTAPVENAPVLDNIVANLTASFERLHQHIAGAGDPQASDFLSANSVTALFRDVARDDMMLFVEHLWTSRQGQLDATHTALRDIADRQSTLQDQIMAQVHATEARMAEQIAALSEQLDAEKAAVATLEAAVAALEATIASDRNAMRTGNVSGPAEVAVQQDGALARWREQWQGWVSSEMSALCARLIANDPKLVKISAAHLGYVGYGMGYEDVRALCEALRANTTVEELDLSIPASMNGPQSPAGRAIGTAGAQLIGELVLPVHPKLRVVSLEYNLIGQGAMPAIAAGAAQSRSLRVLRLGGNALGAAGVAALTPALVGQSALEELDLTGDGSVDDEAAGHIAEVLKSSVLRVLCLASTGVREAGAAALAAALESSCLRELVLDGCAIGDGGAEHLATALARNPRLVRLSLGSVGVSVTGAVIIVGALETNARLQHLRLLSVNVSGEEEAANICAPVVASALQSNTGLATLELTLSPMGSSAPFRPAHYPDSWCAIAKALNADRLVDIWDVPAVMQAVTATTSFACFEALDEVELAGLRTLKLESSAVLKWGQIASLLRACPQLNTLGVSFAAFQFDAAQDDLDDVILGHPLESLTLHARRDALRAPQWRCIEGIVSRTALKALAVRCYNHNGGLLHAVLRALESNKCMESFSLVQDAAGYDRCSLSLGHLLRQNHTLASFRIQGFRLGQDDVSSFAHDLCLNSTLRTLELPGCQLDAIACAAFARAVRSNRTLCELVLRGAPGEYAADIFAAAYDCGRADDLTITV